MRLGVIQLCSGTQVSDNINTTSALIRKCAKEGATLIVTPEMTHLVQKDKAGLWAFIQSEDKDKGVAAFSSLAKELGVTLLIGSLAIKVGDKIANRSYVFGADGAIKARYDKIHLFFPKMLFRLLNFL